MGAAAGSVTITRTQAQGVLAVRLAWTANGGGSVVANGISLDGVFGGAIIEHGTPAPDGSYGYTLEHNPSGVDILTALTNAAGFLTLNGGGVDSVVAIGAANMALSGLYDLTVINQGTGSAQGAITFFLF